MSKRQSLIIIILALLSIFPPLATDMYLSALGAVAQEFETSSAMAELSLSIFFLGLCFGQLIMGPLIDAYGRKIPLLLGTLIFTLSSISLIFIHDITLFNLLRFLQALGACSGMVISRAIVTDLYEGQQAAKNMTILVMLMTIGPIISPTLGSLLFSAFGWRSIFLVMVIIGLTAFILTKKFIPETLNPAERIQQPFQDTVKNAKILLTQRYFLIPVLIAGFVQAGMFAFITGSSGIFQGIYGLNAFDYGLAFAGIAIALFVFGHLNGKLLNKYTASQILSIGLPCYSIFSLITILCSSSTSLWILVIPLWFTIGMISLLSSNAISLAMAAAKNKAGTGSALLGVFQFGLAFAISTCVAIAGTENVLSMSLGIFIPSILALILWKIGNKSVS